MVDWEADHVEGHAGRLHEIAKDSGYFTITEMFQEDETELNVMDFVETEYSPEKCGDDKSVLSKTSSGRSRQRRVCGPRKSVEYEDTQAVRYPQVDSVLPARERVTAAKNKKRKQKRVPKAGLSLKPCLSSQTLIQYPYATILKSLCDRVGRVQSPVSDSFSAKIFDQLRHTDVHYPYASLLEELHQNAEETNSPSTGENVDSGESGELEIADIMKSLHHPTEFIDSLSDTEIIKNENFETPYSSMLLAAVLKQRILEYTTIQSDKKTNKMGIMHGIGKLLKTHMPESRDNDPAPSELQSSALLRKLSFSAQQDKFVERNSHEEQLINWSSSESDNSASSSEADDCEWRPTCQRAQQISRGKRVPRKRKAKRKKKKTVVKNKSFPVVDAPQSLQSRSSSRRPVNARAKRKLENEVIRSSSPLARTEVLPLGLDNDRNDSDDSVVEEYHEASQNERTKGRKFLRRVGNPGRKKTKRRNCLNNNTKPESCTKKGRLRRTKYSSPHETLLKHRENTSDRSWHTPDIDQSGSVESTDNPLGNVQYMAHSGEPQSLLKEYLLKPAGEEMTPTKNCDIPKVETNFLFSRLLQNFKSLAESTPSDSHPSRGQESCAGSSILRGMLASGNSSSDLRGSAGEQETQDTKSFIERMNSLSSVQQYSPENSIFDSSNAMYRVKCEEEIKVECEDEIICKIECEEDSFECQVCHLQFSSGVDLSNHQILFHCNDDGQASSPRTLLPCSVDGLQNSSALQEKLPA